MTDIADLRFFEALNAAGTLSGAARALNVTPSALSIRLKKLEHSLGVQLVVRHARGVTLTREGEHLTAEAQALLQRLDALPEALGLQRSGLAGPLRIKAPFGFGRLHVAPMAGAFSADNPALRITLDLSETPWSECQDADVVIHIGEVRDSSWVAHVLSRNTRWLCASPAYLRRRGIPRHPAELAAFDCLCLRENNEDVTSWRYREPATSAGARRRAGTIRVSPLLTSNDGEVVRNWTVDGLGLALRSRWDVAASVKEGSLVRVLAGWDFGTADILALVPARRALPARAAGFVAHLKAGIGRRMRNGRVG